MIKTTDTRPGFMVFYEDWEVAMQLMEPKDFHEFFTAAFNYARNGELPDAQQHEKMFNVFFDNMRSKLDRDEQRYHQCVEQKRIAGKKSASARTLARQEQQEQTNVEEMPSEHFDLTPPEFPNETPFDYYDPNEPQFSEELPSDSFPELTDIPPQPSLSEEEMELVQQEAQCQPVSNQLYYIREDNEPCDMLGNRIDWTDVDKLYEAKRSGNNPPRFNRSGD